MATYYVAHNGQQQGPYTLSEVELKLSQQKLNWHDYIYDDKLEDWVLLMEYSSFTNLFNKSFENPIELKTSKETVTDELKNREWYILKQNNNYGPFSKAELIQMLQAKTLHEFDFIWKSDMSAWKRLAEVKEFSVEEIRQVFTKESKLAKKEDQNIFYRRKHPRMKYDAEAIVHDHKKVYKSISVEISLGGASVNIEDGQFKIGQQIYLHLKPGKNVPAFNAIGEVVSKKGHVYGLKFIKISAAAKNVIAELTGSTRNSKAA